MTPITLTIQSAKLANWLGALTAFAPLPAIQVLSGGTILCWRIDPDAYRR